MRIHSISLSGPLILAEKFYLCRLENLLATGRIERHSKLASWLPELWGRTRIRYGLDPTPVGSKLCG